MSPSSGAYAKEQAGHGAQITHPYVTVENNIEAPVQGNELVYGTQTGCPTHWSFAPALQKLATCCQTDGVQGSSI